MLWGALIGAVVGVVIEVVAQKMRGEKLDPAKIAKAALVGAVTGLVGGALTGALLKGTTATGGRLVAQRAGAGFVGGSTAGATDRVIHNTIDGRPTFEGVRESALVGGAIGGVAAPLAGPVGRATSRAWNAIRGRSTAAASGNAGRQIAQGVDDIKVETPPPAQQPPPPQAQQQLKPPVPPEPTGTSPALVEPPPPPPPAEPSKGLIQALDPDAPAPVARPAARARAPPRPEKLRLSEKAQNEPVPLDTQQLRSVRRWESWLGEYWDRWQSTAIDHLPTRTQQLLRGRADNAIRDGLTPDDMAAVLKENRGVAIRRQDGLPHDHLKESADSLQSVRNTLLQIDERIAWLVRTGKGAPGEVELLRAKAMDLGEILGRYPTPRR